MRKPVPPFASIMQCNQISVQVRHATCKADSFLSNVLDCDRPFLCNVVIAFTGCAQGLTQCCGSFALFALMWLKPWTFYSDRISQPKKEETLGGMTPPLLLLHFPLLD